MAKLPLFHETSRGGVPDAVSGLATIIRWFVGLLLGVIVLSTVRFIQSVRARSD
jgi:hypothetical protein